MNEDTLYNEIINFLINYNPVKIILFGSFVRKENRTDSDIDLIVNFKDKKSLIELVRIERKLTEKIGIKVDLLTEKSISPYLNETIKTEGKLLYVKN